MKDAEWIVRGNVVLTFPGWGGIRTWEWQIKIQVDPLSVRIARRQLAFSHRGSLGASRDHVHPAHPADDARSRCDLREIGAVARTGTSRPLR
jgi:hypothetical protein